MKAGRWIVACGALLACGAPPLAGCGTSVEEAGPYGTLGSPLSASLVISQVYGGGGNSGATYTHDFIEIFNRGNVAVNTTGMAVQYEPATTATTWDVTPLSGVIQPGHYLLVQQAAGAGGTTPLPAPEVTGSTNLAASGGKIALTTSTTALAGACPTSNAILDLVGFGSGVTCFETAAGPSVSGNNTSLRRLGDGCRETDDNSTNFATSNPPTPRNGSAANFSGLCNPSGAGAASPDPVGQGGTTRLTVAVSSGKDPASTGVTVTADLTPLLGAPAQPFFDDGTNGDVTPGDLVFSWDAFVDDSVAVMTTSLRFTVSDAQARTNSSGSFSVSVIANAAPVAVDDADTILEDTTSSIAVVANDTDADADTLTVAAITAGPANGTAVIVSNGGFVLYTPAAGFNGSDGYTYRVTDGKGESDTGSVAITVTAVDDPPIANDDTYAVTEDVALVVGAAMGVLANDLDDDSTLVVALVTGPANGTLTLQTNGAFTYTPDANFDGDDGFTYTATGDGVTAGPATVTLNISSVNDAPVGAADAYPMAEDAQLAVDAAGGVLANDSDVDSTITAVLVSGVSSGILDLDTDGAFTYTPDPDFNGTDSFVYRASDGALDSGSITVTISVASVNDAPAAVADDYETVEDVPLVVIAANGLLANDGDVDGDPILPVLDAQPSGGSLVVQTSGAFLWTPDADFNGEDSFTYHLTDGEDSSSIVAVSLFVTSVNDPPTPPVATSPENGAVLAPDELELAWEASDDPDEDPLTYVVEILRDGELFATTQTEETTGTIPGRLLQGDYLWRVKARDGEVFSAPSVDRSFRIRKPDDGDDSTFLGCSTAGATRGGGARGGAAMLLALLAAVASVRRRC